MFKIGDTITTKYPNQGLFKVKIIGIDDSKYHCKIPNGIAVIPIKAVNETYKLWI